MSKQKTTQGNTIKGLTGKISNISNAVQPSSNVNMLKESEIPNDIDLRRMAEWALNYLTETPRKQYNYEPVFQCFPLKCPPIPESQDVVVPGDTDTRMDWEWYYMREITGSNKGMEVEIKFHQRVKDYIDEEGRFITHPGCYNEGKTDAVYKKEDYKIHIWGMAKIIKSLSEDFKKTGNTDSIRLAKKVMKALEKLAVWDKEKRCWFTCGMGMLDFDGKPVPNPWNIHPAPVIVPLIAYWEVTGDKEALNFAEAYAKGIMECAQPNGLVINEDGSFEGHSHATMHAIWGVAELGIVLNNKRYIEFAKKAWDFMLTRGTGTGWFPARPDNCNETCCVSDMMSTACLIARWGYTEYYDYVERYMRNYISNLQFIITPEFEEYYRELNKDKGEEAINKGLEVLKKFQGGFIGGSGLNDYENKLLGGVSGFAMFGCCANEGMRAIHTTWSNTIMKLSESRLGPEGVYINMCFNVDSKWARVVSFMPEEGRITVKVKTEGTFFLRPPHWSNRNEIKAYVNTNLVNILWSGDYIRFDAVCGDELTITYPLISFLHEVGALWGKEANRPDLQMKFLWLGNMVVGSVPVGGRTSLFTGKPRILPNPY